jgi:uncharacterized protein
VIFLDTNVPIYLVGTDHPNKLRAQRAIERLAAERFVTDGEVFQELLHRYRAIGRLNGTQDAFDALYGLVSEIYPIGFEEVDHARVLLHEREQLSARDAIHVAVMRQRGVEQILSYDADFDGVPGIERIA